MKSTVNKSAFMDAFTSTGRYDQFGYDGLSVLFDYLEEYEDSAGEEIELDVIALCCDYSHDSIEDIAANYDIDLSDCDDGICTASAYGLEQVDKAKRETVREHLEKNTIICGETDSGFVYCTSF
jgi:hypothetical protein